MRALLILLSFISMAQAHAQPFADAYRGMIESDIYYYFQALKNQDLEALNQTQFACTDEYAEVLIQEVLEAYLLWPKRLAYL